MRMLPPVSVPVPQLMKPSATATPEPPLEPPGIRAKSQGFFTPPKCSFWEVTP